MSTIVQTQIDTPAVAVKNLTNLPRVTLLQLAYPLGEIYPDVTTEDLRAYLTTGQLMKGDNLREKLVRVQTYAEMPAPVQTLLLHLYAPSLNDVQYLNFARAEKIHPLESFLFRYGANIARGPSVARGVAQSLGFALPPEYVADPDVYFYDFIFRAILLDKEGLREPLNLHIEDFSTSAEFQGRLDTWMQRQKLK